MAQIIHNTSMPNDGLGDSLRTAFNDVNTNTTELYNSKVDKVVGKDLSDNNYADADVIKLDGIEAGAEVNVQADFLQDDPTADDYIKNKDSFLIEQNNKSKYVSVITPTDDNSMTDLLTAINAMPIVVSEIETLKFEVNRNSGGVPFTEIYDTNDIGKGNYGSLGTDFVASDLRLIFTNFTTVESIESNPSNVVFTYATLGGLTISQYVTALDPAITLFDTNQTLFKVTDSGVSYLFLGVAGTYGVGFLTAVDSDFVEIPTSTLPITSGVFKQESNGAIHRSDITDSTGGLNSTNLTTEASRATGDYSHADSIGRALGNYSHADSSGTASGNSSHADSSGTASGNSSHADSEGTASGNSSHADSSGTASGNSSHADSEGTASGNNSSASGKGTIANSYSEKTIGTYNENVVANNATAFNAEDLIFSIGIGSDDLNRLTSFFAFKNGGFKFISRLLTNITNATKGFFALDENARPNVHDGTQWQPIAYLSDISGSGITNLSYTAAPTNGTVLSDTGSDAIIPLANSTNAGLLSSAEKNKIATAIQSSEWFDWSGNSVITGWSSFVFKKINCKLIDDCLFVNYNISGTSNAGTAKFTLPFVNKEPTTKFDSSGYNANAGVPLTTPARVQVPIEVNEVEILRDLAGASYTASGIKHVSGGFFMSVYKTSVFNKGIGGNNTSDVIARLADINSLKANLAIVMIGTNDWRIPITGSRRTPTQYKTNLTTIVNSLQANGSQVLLLQFPPIVGAESDYVCPFFGQPSGCDSNATAIPFREKIVEVVSEKSTLYLDINQDFLDIGQPTNLSTSYMQNFANRGYTDGVHPQPIGANFIAQKIADYLNANNLSYDRIVCIGDSITAGDGLTGLNTATGQTYPAQLKNILNS